MINTQTPPPATTVVNPTGAPVTNTVANHAKRLEKFNGQNFKRKQQNMFFYLTTLGLARFLKETVPQVEPPTEGQSSNAQDVQAMEAWKHSYFLCHNYVLNGLIDPLYNVYCKTTTAKELWESLEHKYKTKDVATKKFVVAIFLDYKMVDSKNVTSQVQDLHVLIHDIHAGGMTLSETFQVVAIIEKLPPSWKDTYTPDSAKANMVEHVGSSSRSNSKGKGKGKRKNDKKGKGKSEYLSLKAGIVKHKFQRTCYNCDQPGHRAANYKMPKRLNPRQANIVNDDVDMIAMVSDVCAMISEVNLVGINHGSWWIDTGATRHVCADKSMFHSFKAVDNRQKLYMGNSATTDIKGEGDVVLKMTSEKELKLTNVLYVLEIRKNLVSGWLLNKFGFRLVFESDKFVLSKNQIYVGKGYAMNGMFKLNIMVVKNEINKMNSSAYLIESSNVWHGRLGHVNHNSMHRLIKFNSIPNFHIDSKYKCETCVKAKLTRTSFKSIKRKTKPLDRVHTDICDLKSLPTKGGNKYFITFIDDCTKYCYVYLLKSKDEAIDKFFLYKTKVENQLGKKIKSVRSDKGAKRYCRKEEPYPERMVTAMLISSGMSQDMWGEAVLMATYLLNKIPRKEKEDTPYELWMGQKPSYQYLRVWGCLAKLVDLPPGCKPLGYKWIFKKKMKADGTIDKYKVRMILAIAALRNLEVHQMDVKTAFLNEDLEEEIYMNQPEGFIAPGQEGKDTSSGYVILCLYVDDMLVVGSNDKMIKSTKEMLKLKFDMKDMGLADVILGIKIIRTQNGLVLSQAHYVDKILNTHNAGDSGLARTPIDTSLHLSKNRGVGVAQLEYSRIIGMLMYLMTSTRPDLAYVVSRLKFIALDKCREKAEWLRQFVKDIPRKWDFWAKMGSKLLNSCEPARPANTNAASKVRLCAYLFVAHLFPFNKVQVCSVIYLGDKIDLKL
nr:Pol polyprotein [Tanacetum cinerariifolium]